MVDIKSKIHVVHNVLLQAYGIICFPELRDVTGARQDHGLSGKLYAVQPDFSVKGGVIGSDMQPSEILGLTPVGPLEAFISCPAGLTWRALTGPYPL